MKKVMLVVSQVVIGSLLVSAVASAATHVVIPGDSFWKVSQQYGTTISRLMTDNSRTSTTLYVGERLTVPDQGCAPQVIPPAPAPITPKPVPKPVEQPVGGLLQFEAEVVRLTNAERTKAGLVPFLVDAKLSQVARLKSVDMAQNNYFGHTSPTYGSPFDMMAKFGVTYRTAAENIAKGQRTPQEVVTAWMNSSGHRANILNANLTYIGVGYNADLWTQQFIGK